MPPMERRLFFTSPVDHHNLGSWDGLGRSLKAAVAASCGRDVSIEVGTRPVFGYDTDVDETLAELEELRLGPREIRVDLWCSIFFYGTICVTLGPGLRRQERRALTRRLSKKELARHTLLREHEGAYDLDSGRVFGYQLFPGDDRARSTITEILEPFDGPVYLGEEWLVQDEDGILDNESFELIASRLKVAGSGVEGAVEEYLALFLARDPEAEARAWLNATASGQGLIALYADDAAEAKLVRRFTAFEDLPILLAEAPSANMRVTIGRCHDDDSLVVVYGPPWAPEVDEPVLFMI